MKKKRLYIIRKFVVATSIIDAIKNEKDFDVHDVWLEENAHKDAVAETVAAIRKQNPMGFEK